MQELRAHAITMYTTKWCGDCRRLKGELKRAGVEYREVDVDEDSSASDFVIRVNNGNRSVPTVVFQDGSSLTEPSGRRVLEHLAQFSPPSAS